VNLPRALFSSLALATVLAVAASSAGAGSASAAQATPPAEPAAGTPDTPLPIGEAQSGLSRILDDNRPTDPEGMTRLAGCPIVERKALEGALHGGDFDDRLPAWEAEVYWDEYEPLNPAMVGVTCLGDSDGVLEDDAVGTFAVIFAVDLVSPVTFSDLAEWGLPSGTFSGSTPAAGGELASECVDEDEFHGCVSVWHSSRLAVGLMVLEDDDVAVSGSATDAVLVDVVPDVVHTLATYGAVTP
jgi:hypothetical protein